MLVLTRKLREQIRIGDNITISVVRIRGNTVRVGIEAPRQVRVVRGELTTDGPLCDAERGDMENNSPSSVSVGAVDDTDAESDSRPAPGAVLSQFVRQVVATQAV